MLDTYKGIASNQGFIPSLAVIHAEIKFLNGKELLFHKIDDLFKTHS